MTEVAIVGDTVFLAETFGADPYSPTGAVLAGYDATTGAVRWERTAPPSARLIAVDGGPLLVAGGAGRSGSELAALDPTSGTLLWCRSSSADMHVEHGGADGVVLTEQDPDGKGDTTLSSLDPGTGAQRCSLTYPPYLSSPLVVWSARAVAVWTGTDRPATRAYDTATGALLWTDTDNSPQPRAGGPDRVFLTDSAGLRAVDPATGTTLWRSAEPVDNPILVGPDVLLPVEPSHEEDGAAPEPGPTMFLVDGATGVPRWTVGQDVADGRRAGAHLVGPDRLLLDGPSRRGTVSGFSVVDLASGATRTSGDNDGAMVWTVNASGSVLVTKLGQRITVLGPSTVALPSPDPGPDLINPPVAVAGDR